MTYFELEQKVKALETLLKEGAANPSTDWAARVQATLNPPKVEHKFGSLNRWEGEECGTCKHSSTVHSRGGLGLCCQEGCACMLFKSTGRANQSAKG